MHLPIALHFVLLGQPAQGLNAFFAVALFAVGFFFPYIGMIISLLFPLDLYRL
jgi:hypothetical protein